MDNENKYFDLMTTVEYGGCSAKIPAAVLEKVLLNLPRATDSNVLVDIDTHDDAGVYKINDDLALIFTTDFFPPICSNPFEFGEIAAANSISDVYAMGGEPFMALNIAMFPSKGIPIEAYAQILEGAASTAKKANTIILGGHTIDDNPPKFGLAVIGRVKPSEVITNAGLKPNQLLILTKPIGSGIITAAKRMGLASNKAYTETLEWMKTLNDKGAEVMRKFRVTGGTDITGFGLFGHAHKMAKASNVDIDIYSARVPFLPEAYKLAEEGCIPGAGFRNEEYIGDNLHLYSNDYNCKMICFDAQTSGGLLFGIDAEHVDSAINMLKSFGLSYSAVIGKVSPNGTGQINFY
ncbi:MAG: selenide, water dikinase SelD [Bacteroidales bacterium]|nr:selenide, water dikinase SelD [Bacteroidales bacterium]MBN2749171.1 selenide, water dikinase SelD [Bacteroidales bacterium]